MKRRGRGPRACRLGPGARRYTRSVRPLLSLVVVVYDMPEQARRTLHSLSPAYQRGTRPDEYEIIVVENASDRILGADAVRAAAANARYFLREETSQSPAGAVNFGVSRARGDQIGILVDGARLVTPGITGLSLLAGRMSEHAVVSVPGYHLGLETQQEAVRSGYDEAAEARLLSDIDWPSDGYRLFDVACFSGSCAAGFLRPYSESNCVCLPRRMFELLGGFDPRFQSPGGGYVNLDFYARICESADAVLFVTPGEGTFHQFHRGVSTGGVSGDAREQLLERFAAEYREIRGKEYRLAEKETLILGPIPPPARRFVRLSAAGWD